MHGGFVKLIAADFRNDTSDSAAQHRSYAQSLQVKKNRPACSSAGRFVRRFVVLGYSPRSQQVGQCDVASPQFGQRSQLSLSSVGSVGLSSE